MLSVRRCEDVGLFRGADTPTLVGGFAGLEAAAARGWREFAPEMAAVVVRPEKSFGSLREFDAAGESDGRGLGLGGLGGRTEDLRGLGVGSSLGRGGRLPSREGCGLLGRERDRDRDDRRRA